MVPPLAIRNSIPKVVFKGHLGRMTNAPSYGVFLATTRDANDLHGGTRYPYSLQTCRLYQVVVIFFSFVASDHLMN